MPTEGETALAELIAGACPAIPMLRFVNSGTEAVMSAIRLARAATGRTGIIKCTGCYHGHSDGLLVQAGSGATTLGVPSSPGVPAGVTADTILAPYNDLEAMAQALSSRSGSVAAVIIEPIAGNMGCVPPQDGYLRGLRELCDRHQALLIFDEVMTGFRVAWGGAQRLYGMAPDLTCLGKVIGGGLPCAAYGGSKELMSRVAPCGPVYQAGTLSGNPLATAAGLATLEALADGTAYTTLEHSAAMLADGLKDAAARAGVALQVNRVGSMLCPFFSGRPIRNYEHALGCDTAAYAAFFNGMLDRGVILPPSQFETWFLSTAHDDTAIEQTLAAAREAFTLVGRHEPPLSRGSPSV
jgi:glutamate-1-semialdehyde 2,1-aminomutase